MMNLKYAKIIYGHELKTLRIKVQQYISEGDKIYSGLKKLVPNKNMFFALKKQHCLNCEFQTNCLTILKEKDDLSLLGRISQKEINKLNNWSHPKILNVFEAEFQLVLLTSIINNNFLR